MEIFQFIIYNTEEGKTVAESNSNFPVGRIQQLSVWLDQHKKWRVRRSKRVKESI